MDDNYQFSINDYLSMGIKNRTVMDLTSWINSQGKAQYQQMADVINKAYEDYKNDAEILDRMTNAVSVYVLNQSLGYMEYLRKENGDG